MIPSSSTSYSDSIILAGGNLSPTSVAGDERTEVKKTVSSLFTSAPQKLFGKSVSLNLEDRTLEEKQANQVIREEFYSALQGCFGPILTEYLYPKEQHDRMLKSAAPLAPLQAQEIKRKGMEMVDTLAEYCKQQLEGNSRSEKQPDVIDQAMIRYADAQEAESLQSGSTIELFSHTAQAIGGGAVAAFAVLTMGHLTPTDVFFLADLLSHKKLSKEIEGFITTRLVQHMEFHLEAYIKERQGSHNPMSSLEEAELRRMFKGDSETLSHESLYPSAKSGGIHTAALAMGMAPVHNPLDALKVIFQGETFDTGVHNQLFRQGVTTLVESLQKIQESKLKTQASAVESSKIKKAIAAARQHAEAIVSYAEAAVATAKNEEQEKAIAASALKKKNTLPPPWRRGI